ncbi:MAG: hypothetical protein ACXWF2_07515 [Usitatibacter sp.]
MKRNAPQENTARVIAVAIGLFATLLALGIADGVFAKLPPETLVALTVFAIGYAIATYLLDRQVRAFVDRVLAWAGILISRATLRRSPRRAPQPVTRSAAAER